jgi:hypothetical protein
MTIHEILSAIDAEIARLQQARNILANYSDPTTATRKAKKGTTPARPATKRVLSAEARARIVASQKKRWAAAKKAK